MQVRYLSLCHLPIFDQLRIEEALLRTSSDNWIIVNRASPPALVLGIGGKVEELIDLDHLELAPIPLIRRFSGGGTVVVDANTLFVTFIFKNQEMEVTPYPQPIMQWTEQLYRPLMGIDFQLRENDYCFGEHKFGGNAQSITKERWLHHTSFLWSYDPKMMAYLKLPKRQPSYRQQRTHQEFLTTLSQRFSSIEKVTNELTTLFQTHFELIPSTMEEATRFLRYPHRKNTRLLPLAEPSLY